jgi:putative transposase
MQCRARLYVHLVWGTHERLPLLHSGIEDQLYAALSEKCRGLRCFPLAVGGITDHVHLLVQLAKTVAVAELVQQLKGSTSHMISYVLPPGVAFAWQGGYGAMTLSERDVPAVSQYVLSQKAHHAAGRILKEWERVA